jgi:hypothetical protein
LVCTIPSGCLDIHGHRGIPLTNLVYLYISQNAEWFLYFSISYHSFFVVMQWIVNATLMWILQSTKGENDFSENEKFPKPLGVMKGIWISMMGWMCRFLLFIMKR